MFIREREDYQRTFQTISYLRQRQDLPPLTEAEADFSMGEAKSAEAFGRLRPIENVPSPFAFKLSSSGNIVLAESAANVPAFPSAMSERPCDRYGR
jgi:hypothetical protein